MPGMDDDSMPMSMPMTMDLTLKCTCQVGKLFISAWDIDTCGKYYLSLAFIAVFCFLRHLLTMHKTKLILRLAEHDTGTCIVRHYFVFPCLALSLLASRHVPPPYSHAQITQA